MTRQLFKFVNGRGSTVKGVIARPTGRTSGVGVVYLPGIVLGATAVHRLGLDLADRLAEQGHPVCLFDPSGIGESEGDHPAGTHHELAVWIESGSCVEDTLEAIDAFAERTGVDEVVVIGHCGGALTAMYSAASHDKVRGAFLISPPTVAMGARHELDRESVSRQYFAEYVRKLRSPEAWLRLLRGDSSYETIVRLIRGKLRRARPVAEVATRAFNPRLRRSLDQALTAGKRVAIVFGDRDPDIDDFRDFRTKHVPDVVCTRIFDDTSHGFVTEESMALLFGEVDRFVGAPTRRGRRGASPG